MPIVPDRKRYAALISKQNLFIAYHHNYYVCAQTCSHSHSFAKTIEKEGIFCKKTFQVYLHLSHDPLFYIYLHMEKNNLFFFLDVIKKYLTLIMFYFLICKFIH
jgi:hypothetical protein